MTMKLGKPKYEQGKKNYFAFKKGQNTFTLRVLPPMGELAEAGKWSVFHRVEFGYTTTEGRLKPFLSPRVVNFNRMVEVESETHLRRETLKAQQAQAKASGNAALTEQCTKLLQKYNQDAKHYMNVVDQQGNVGLFKIGHRGFQALKAEIERLRSEGIDPVGIADGRFFVFARSGTGKDTIYTVNEYKQKQEMDTPNGKVVADVSFPHSINDAILGKLETDAFELNKVYPTVTPEEEYRIVHEGATAVDEIFGKKAKAPETNPAATTTETTTESSTGTEPIETPVSASNGTPLDGSVVLTNETVAETVAETPAAQLQTPTTSTPAPTSDVAAMSDEEFFKKIESGNF